MGSIRRNNQALMTNSLCQIFPLFLHKYLRMFQNFSWLVFYISSSKVVSFKPAFAANKFGRLSTFRIRISIARDVITLNMIFSTLLCHSVDVDMTISQLAVSQSETMK